MSTITIGNNHFINAQAKQDFMKLVQCWLLNSKKPVNRRLYKFHSHQNIARIIQEKKANKKEYFHYDVVQKDNKDILIVKKKYSSSPEVQILSWDEMFNVFMNLHLESGHKGKYYLMNAVKNVKYPIPCLAFFERICSVCNKKRPSNKRNIARRALKTSLVYIIRMIQIQEEHFHYLLIHADKETNYVIIRPVIAKCVHEITMELVKIFTQFGPPNILYVHSYNPCMTERISNQLDKICPGFAIVVEHKPPCYDLPAIVTDKIEEWMADNSSSHWDIGCFSVQSQLNNDISRKPEAEIDCEVYTTPFSLLFTKEKHTKDSLNKTLKHQIRMRKTVKSFTTKIRVQKKKCVPKKAVKNFKKIQKVTDIVNCNKKLENSPSFVVDDSEKGTLNNEDFDAEYSTKNYNDEKMNEAYRQSENEGNCFPHTTNNDDKTMSINDKQTDLDDD